MFEFDFPKPGDRVCAFPVDLASHEDNAHVYIYGCGVYEEDGIPPVSFSVSEDADSEVEEVILIPKITLDNDRGIIWGTECLFTYEESVFEEAEGKEIVLLDIAAERARWARDSFSSN